jgi:hypothetical protein
VEREGADSLLGATRHTLRVPSFIDDVISSMRQMGQFIWTTVALGTSLMFDLLIDMSVEGIFRKNGNIRRLKDLTEAIDRDPSSVDLTQDNPVQLAALLKKFLRDLPDPLMTFKLHKLFIATQCAFPTRYIRLCSDLLSQLVRLYHKRPIACGCYIWFHSFYRRAIETQWRFYPSS